MEVAEVVSLLLGDYCYICLSFLFFFFLRKYYLSGRKSGYIFN